MGVDRRSVKFSAVPSSTLMRAVLAKSYSAKSKHQRRTSRLTERAVPKLVFDYGPTTYRGLLLHRKIKIAPFAEHFQKKYPQIRVYYHPITDYNMVVVRLKECVIQQMLQSNVRHSATEDITKNPFYKVINLAIQRMFQYPNLLVKPFRDAVCLMTHNIDIDYDMPWYRTEFQRAAMPEVSQSHSVLENDNQAEAVVAAPCLVETAAPRKESAHWETFRTTVENLPGFDQMLEEEFIDLVEFELLKDK